MDLIRNDVIIDKMAVYSVGGLGTSYVITKMNFVCGCHYYYLMGLVTCIYCGHLHILWSRAYTVVTCIYCGHVHIPWSPAYTVVTCIYCGHVHILWSHAYTVVKCIYCASVACCRCMNLFPLHEMLYGCCKNIYYVPSILKLSSQLSGYLVTLLIS